MGADVGVFHSQLGVKFPLTLVIERLSVVTHCILNS